MIFDHMASPQGHQFDPMVKILLALCSTNYPHQFDMSHNHFRKNKVLSHGHPSAQSPTPGA